MEGFIRDKYEAKRYITVENGGLGGALPGRFGASSAFSSSNTLGPRPTQQPVMPRRYDDVGRSTSSMSYASRFQSNGSHPPPPRALPQSDPKSHLDAVTRATTLRELVKMGFSTQLSLRAVEAASGDLQRAVDWLLQDVAKDAPSKSAPALAPTRPSTTSKPVAADLLDFSDTPGNPPATKASTVKTDTNSDFADFGDFERALPTASSVSTSAIPSTQGSKSLSSSLADLYKQKRPAVPPPLSSDLKSPAHGPAKTASGSANRNTGALNVTGESIENVKTGLPVFGIKPSIPSTNDSQRPFGFQNHEATHSTPNLQNAQPPPPPMQEMAFPASEDGPLPPSPTTHSMLHLNAKRLENPAAPSEMKHESQVRKAPIKLEREEDQDPFAALSMMALSSASSSKKSAPILSAVPVAASRDTAASKERGDTPGSPGFNDFFG